MVALVLGCISAAAMFVYVPAAVHIGRLRKSGKKYDSAAVEAVYLVLQFALILGELLDLSSCQALVADIPAVVITYAVQISNLCKHPEGSSCYAGDFYAALSVTLAHLVWIILWLVANILYVRRAQQEGRGGWRDNMWKVASGGAEYSEGGFAQLGAEGNGA